MRELKALHDAAKYDEYSRALDARRAAKDFCDERHAVKSTVDAAGWNHDVDQAPANIEVLVATPKGCWLATRICYKHYPPEWVPRNDHNVAKHELHAPDCWREIPTPIYESVSTR